MQTSDPSDDTSPVRIPNHSMSPRAARRADCNLCKQTTRVQSSRASGRKYSWRGALSETAFECRSSDTVEAWSNDHAPAVNHRAIRFARAQWPSG